MRPRIFVRTLSEKEQQSLATGLRSLDAFVLRHSQILLASARGETAPSIAKALSCDEQDVLVKQCMRLGWMARPVSIETMRQMLGRLEINWKRAKHWITSPDPLYQQKKPLATDC